MLTLLLLRKLFKASVLKYIPTFFTLISAFLIIFLALACHQPSSGFSGIYLIEATTSDSHILRAGYMRMCESTGTVANINGTLSAAGGNSTSRLVCHGLGQFKGSDISYKFSKHVVRPYFVILAAVFTCIALAGSIVALFLPSRIQVSRTMITITSIALGFTIITACWQQVAVQAAVVLIPGEVKRGHRAAGMVWSSVVMLVFAVLGNVWLLKHEDGEEEETMPVVTDYVPSGPQHMPQPHGAPSSDTLRTKFSDPFANPTWSPSPEHISPV